MALTDDQINEIKGIFYEELPCSTNKVCKEVGDVKNTLRFVIFGVIGIIIMLIVNLVIVQSSAKSVKIQTEYTQKQIESLEKTISRLR